MNWHSVIDALVETEKDTVPTPTPMPTALSPAAAPQPFTPAQTAPVTTAPVEGFLTTLRDKLSAVGEPINKLDAVLATLTAIPEGSLRVTTAVGVLKATAGITLDMLQNAYRGRLAALDTQERQFAAAVAQQTEGEVARREEQVKQITTQLQQLTQQRETLNTELIAARTKIATAQAGFTGAVVTLKQELTEAANRLQPMGAQGA